MQVRAPIRAGNARGVSPSVVGDATLGSHVRVDHVGGICTGSGVEDGVGIWFVGARPVCPGRAPSDEDRPVVALRNISITGKTWCE